MLVVQRSPGKELSLEATSSPASVFKPNRLQGREMQMSTQGVNNPVGHHAQTKLPGGSVETHTCSLMKAQSQSGLAGLCLRTCSVVQ